MKRTIILTLIVFVNIYLFALTDPPKREFRGAWIATVANLDWPSSPTASVSTQKVELIEMLDVLGDCGINAVIFQVRTECDALYQSNYEPWSYWLTGSQGSSPGLFDPLEFIIDEAHQRGMELHAWFNPYRAVNRIGDYSIHSSHVSKLHPEWILTFSPINKKYLDPGLPMVEDYIVTVIMDVVNRYDVDGVHFDDYFYPYPNSGVSFSGITTEDDATFQLYNCGFTDRKAWRRDNINKMIEAVYDSIQAVKPYVKFGVSPFGIWKNGVPSGITGLDAYNYIYCDAPEWLNQHTVDYIVPQLYWKIGGNQDYKKLLPWWSTKRNDRHLYPGQIFSSSYSTDELINQVLFNRQTEGVGGNVLFRSRHILYNTLGFNNYMQSDFHRYPALWPVMSWKDTIQPNIPLQIRYETLSGNVAGLLWDIPEIASDGDSAYRYVLYRSTNQSMDQQFIDNPANIVTICGNREIIPEEPEGSGPYYYAVSALDRNSNESALGNVLAVLSPDAPQLLIPADLEKNQRDTINFQWDVSSFISSFKFQISNDSQFNVDSTIEISGIIEHSSDITDLLGQEMYYWRVRAHNAGGTGDFSDTFSFETGFPELPILNTPPHKTSNLPTTLTLNWFPATAASSYRIQVARSNDFNLSSIVFDTLGAQDTSITVDSLQYSKYHYWRVYAANEFGHSTWSESFRFKTMVETATEDLVILPDEYRLYRNYPNPFNPFTTIRFMIPNREYVHLILYDIKGNYITTLKNDILEAGVHKVTFDALSYPSGIYIYRLITDKFQDSKKMILIK